MSARAQQGVCLVIGLFLLVACTSDPAPSEGLAPSPTIDTAPSVSPTATPTPGTPTPAASTIPASTRKNLRDSLAARASFEDIKDEYDLQVTEQTLNFLAATSGKIPGVTFAFGNFGIPTFRLNNVSAAASLMLTEYVGMRFEDIPILIDYNTQYDIQLHDDLGSYQITDPADPYILGPDDLVFMVP